MSPLEKERPSALGTAAARTGGPAAAAVSDASRQARLVGALATSLLLNAGFALADVLAPGRLAAEKNAALARARQLSQAGPEAETQRTVLLTLGAARHSDQLEQGLGRNQPGLEQAGPLLSQLVGLAGAAPAPNQSKQREQLQRAATVAACAQAAAEARSSARALATQDPAVMDERELARHAANVISGQMLLGAMLHSRDHILEPSQLERFSPAALVGSPQFRAAFPGKGEGAADRRAFAVQVNSGAFVASGRSAAQSVNMVREAAQTQLARTAPVRGK